MCANARPLVSKTRLRGIPNGSHVFSGSLECPVPNSVSGLLRPNSFCPKGVIGGIGRRSGVRLPAQDPFTSWIGAGPPGVGSSLNLFPLYKLSFVPAEPAWAIARTKKPTRPLDPRPLDQ